MTARWSDVSLDTGASSCQAGSQAEQVGFTEMFGASPKVRSSRVLVT